MFSTAYLSGHRPADYAPLATPRFRVGFGGYFQPTSAHTALDEVMHDPKRVSFQYTDSRHRGRIKKNQITTTAITATATEMIVSHRFFRSSPLQRSCGICFEPVVVTLTWIRPVEYPRAVSIPRCRSSFGCSPPPNDFQKCSTVLTNVSRFLDIILRAQFERPLAVLRVR